MDEEIAQRYLWLIDQVASHDQAYYLEDNPIVSDAQYDELVNEIKEIENRFPHSINPRSPTQKVGGYSNKVFSPVTHGTPMLSLNNALTEPELINFDKRCK